MATRRHCITVTPAAKHVCTYLAKRMMLVHVLCVVSSHAHLDQQG